jgi:signal transduction histidine kinase
MAFMNTKAFINFPSRRANQLCRIPSTRDCRPQVFERTGGKIQALELPRQANHELLAANNKLQRRVALLEAALVERTAQLHETIAELETFAHSISHDMRTPLRTIQGFSELLLDQHASQLDAAGSTYLHKINAASARMDAMIKEVCTYTRAVRATVKLEALDLPLITSQILSAFPQLQGQTVELGIPGDLPCAAGA